MNTQNTVVCVLVAATPLLAHPANITYTGQTQPQLISDGQGLSRHTLRKASAEMLARLPAPLAEGELAFTQEFAWELSTRAFPIVLVESPVADPVLYADIDNDGKFSPAERHEFAVFSLKSIDRQTATQMQLDLDLRLELPFEPGGVFPGAKVRLFHSFEMRNENTRFLWEEISILAQGIVEVANRKLLVQYSVDPFTGGLRAANALRRMDVNGDGKCDATDESPEHAYKKPDDESEPIFRLGNRLLSFESVDRKTGRITLVERSPDQYDRIDLAVGKRIPDFAFTDLQGTARRLSEYRGKHVLIDVWGTWCSPCVKQFPNLRALHDKYSAQDFEILGLNVGDEVDELRTFVNKGRWPWVQATAPSVEKTVEKMKIAGYPMTILLDPNGVIVELNPEPVALLNTLQGRLSATGKTGAVR